MTRTLRLTSVLWAAAFTLCATETKTWSQDEYSSFEKGEHREVVALERRAAPPGARVPVRCSTAPPCISGRWRKIPRATCTRGAAGRAVRAARESTLSPKTAKASRSRSSRTTLKSTPLRSMRKDRVYAGTSPDGKVYRISAGGKPEVFFDPKAKYIWAMAFDSHGDLFVATGDRGEIYRVGAGRQGQGVLQDLGDACTLAGAGRERQPDRGHRARRTGPPSLAESRRLRALPDGQARDHGSGGGQERGDLCRRRGQ